MNFRFRKSSRGSNEDSPPAALETRSHREQTGGVEVCSSGQTLRRFAAVPGGKSAQHSVGEAAESPEQPYLRPTSVPPRLRGEASPLTPNRRAFLKACGRYGLLAGLAALTTRLLTRDRGTDGNQRCLSAGVCRNCAELARCDLPNAQDAKQALRKL
jgi:hypothetical protein